MSLKTVFESQPDRRYIMFGGKGGLGKTTLSATSAVWLARQGKRVLLFSVDPQASLSDIFQKDIFGFERVPEEIDNYIAAASAEPAGFDMCQEVYRLAVSAHRAAESRHC